ncbi:MAG: 30S ribosomal protein S18 [Armatimonadetes bacterium]|nr:30S ribosomal protein S18 [Armatimonadota bacterium]
MTAPPKRRAPGKWKRPRRKVCGFCVDKATSVEWKNISKLRRYQTDRGKMVARRTSGTCAKHQRLVTDALKRARHMALMPYVAEG